MTRRPRILIACEVSGRVRDAFALRGWDAWSCDILPAAAGQHITGDVVALLESTGARGRRFGWASWDAVASFPPCTYLCSSGMHWTRRGLRDPQLTEDALKFVSYLLAGPARFKALENPTGIISTRIRKPDQRIQPYEFGEDASKGTCLWLENLPALRPTAYVKPRLVCPVCGRVTAYDGQNAGCAGCGCEPGRLRPRWGNQTDSGQNRLGPSKTRAAERAVTYQGIARAMAYQWGDHMRKELGL